MKTLIIILSLGFFGMCHSQQLVYKPVNPMFGGDTFNYQQLLASANAQNSFEDDNATDNRSSLQQFSESVNRQVLSQLSRSLFDQQLGDGLAAGTYTIGTLSLEIYDSAEGLVINILDTSTGEETQIIVPGN